MSARELAAMQAWFGIIILSAGLTAVFSEWCAVGVALGFAAAHLAAYQDRLRDERKSRK